MLASLTFAAVVCLGSAARADVSACPRDTGNPVEMEQKGRALFDEALEREPADPRTALELLTCVQRFADKPAVSLRVGIIAERLGNKRLAADSFERYLALAGDAAPDRAEMQKHIEHLKSELARAAPPPPPKSEPEPIPVPPPVHERSALPGWIVAGVGGVLLLGGGYLLLDAKSKNDDVHSITPGTTYWNSAAARESLDSAKREQTFGYVALALGAAATATGVWLILDARHEVRVGASAGPGFARTSVGLRF